MKLVRKQGLDHAWLGEMSVQAPHCSFRRPAQWAHLRLMIASGLQHRNHGRQPRHGQRIIRHRGHGMSLVNDRTVIGGIEFFPRFQHTAETGIYFRVCLAGSWV